MPAEKQRIAHTFSVKLKERSSGLNTRHVVIMAISKKVAMAEANSVFPDWKAVDASIYRARSSA